MKGLIYQGPRDVHVVKVADPRKKETDALVRIASTNILLGLAYV
jgi:hypothetical protein